MAGGFTSHLSRTKTTMNENPKSPDRMIMESAALGVAIGGIVAGIINLLGLKKTIILFGIGYLLLRLYF